MKLAVQSALSALFGLVFFGVALFVPAGTFCYWQAWVFIAVFGLAATVSSVYLTVKDPAALRRRMKAGPTAESRPLQRMIITGVVLLVALTVVVSAVDHRFGWSALPLAVVVTGNVLVAAGLLLAQWVVVQNGYAGASIIVETDQSLVTTGLYGWVRHPMYAGTLVMLIGTPLALGSYWGLLVVIPAALLLAARIVDEEKMLDDELAGYSDYQRQVRYRLVPFVW